jgi:hypothetical protein
MEYRASEAEACVADQCGTYQKNGLHVDIDGNDLDRLREMLEDEYRMLERVRDFAGVASLYQGLAHEVRKPALVHRAQLG